MLIRSKLRCKDDPVPEHGNIRSLCSPQASNSLRTVHRGTQHSSETTRVSSSFNKLGRNLKCGLSRKQEMLCFYKNRRHQSSRHHSFQFFIRSLEQPEDNLRGSSSRLVNNHLTCQLHSIRMRMMMIDNYQTVFHFQESARRSSKLIKRVGVNKHRQISISRNPLIRRRDTEVFH